MRPIAIDLFAGAGGLSLGLEQAGFDVRAAVEIDPVHCAVHHFNFPDTTVFCRSVAEISGREIRERSSIGDEDITVVAGGSPCQGFSLIGKRALEDPRNGLVAEFARIVEELQPKYFVFENVPGLTLGQHRAFLDEVIERFQSAGYEVLLPYRVLRAVDFGVPQNRRRLVLIGARRGQSLPEYPSPTHFARIDKRSQDPLHLPLSPSVMEALGDVPDADKFEELLSSDEVYTEFGTPSPYAATLRGLVPDATDYSYSRSWDPDKLTSSLRTEHTDESVRRFSETKGGTTEKISRFLRLDPNGVCNTLRAGTAAERGAHTSPRPIHPIYNRVITVREAARLHSYPDWFRLHRTKWHGFRQIGNSVPPLLARAVGDAILNAASVVPDKPCERIALGNPELLSMDMRQASQYFSVDYTSTPRRHRVLATI